jgi:GST-like protein
MRLYGVRGWGSAIVEAQLDHYALPYTFADAGDVLGDAAAKAALAPLNPAGQVPTLVLDDGAVLTESAAITLWLAEATGSDALVPAPGDPRRAAFLRWLIFLVANIYPCFTFADVPERFVAAEAARRPFREAVDRWMLARWAMVEAAAGGPFFLGERLSAIDIYLAVMTLWRPKRPWFAANAPRVHAAALAAEADPRLAPAFARNVG